MDAFAEVKRRPLSLPTNRDAPEKLAASYRLTSLAPGTTLHLGDFLLYRVSVVNTGGAVWLDRAQWEKGEVRLRWRWFEEGHEDHLTLGGWLLGYDVLPGQAYEFTVEIATPGKPGHYQLELGLVSTQVTSFADQGTAPLQIPMYVMPPVLSSLGRVRAHPGSEAEGMTLHYKPVRVGSHVYLAVLGIEPCDEPEKLART